MSAYKNSHEVEIKANIGELERVVEALRNCLAEVTIAVEAFLTVLHDLEREGP